MFPNSDPNCKFCLNRGVTAQETEVHCFLDCSRVSPFWLKIENFLKLSKNDYSLTEIDKIFGALIPGGACAIVVNYVIQNAQKAIWKCRQKLEYKNEEIDPWENFKKHTTYSLNRLYRLMGSERFCTFFITHRIAKISRYKPVLNVE